MADSYSVRARLSAQDSGFTSTLNRARNSVRDFGSSIKSGFAFGVLQGVGQAAFHAITNSVTGLISEVNSANASWKTFTQNMKMLGKSDKEIAKVKNELQDFAQKTIYSSSDMATTFAQLEAVGVKNTTSLVKGFGGLASAAENPQQAMKTLSQQATQMAAKPKVAWQDFKLMLEQTPAGIAAVAKEMGMTTSELVTNVQDGKISTDKFFDAIAKVGTNKAFTKLATEAKTVGQAMDGLKETVGNKLTPAFEVLNQKGISVINKLADKLSGIDADALANKVSNMVDKCGKYFTAFKEAFSGVGSEVWGAVKEVTKAIFGMNGAFGSTESVAGFKSTMKSVANVIKSLASFCKKHSKAIGTLIKWLPVMAIGMKGLRIASIVAPGVIAFTKGIAGLAAKGIGGIASKLFGISKSQKKVGDASVSSGTQMLQAAKSYALMGVAVLTIALGFALLTQSAIALANAGGGAIAVMAGLVVALAALGVGMALLLKTLAPMGAQLMPVATAMLAMGAAVLLVAAGFALLAVASIALANAGGGAIAIMVGMVAAIALLAVGAAALAPMLTAGAVGLIAFGAALLLCAVAAVLTAASILIVSKALPTLTEYGLSAAKAITAIGVSLVVFAAGAIVAGAACLVLAVGLAAVAAVLLVVGAAAVAAAALIIVFGVGMTVGAVATLAMVAALKAVSSQMKTIASNAKKAEKSLKSMRNSVSFVESGLNALGSKAKSAMKSVIKAFNDTDSKAESAGRKVGKAFVNGLESGLKTAPKVARNTSADVTNALNSGQSGAYSAGAFISQGFANGMTSMLGFVRSAAAKLAAAAEKAVRAVARIHSPSKVSAQLGAWWGEGYENGLLSTVKNVYAAAERLVSIPAVATPDLAMAYSGELSSDYDYYRNTEITIEVPLTVDGKEVAHATASYMQNELDKRQTRNDRKHGRI